MLSIIQDSTHETASERSQGITNAPQHHDPNENHQSWKIIVSSSSPITKTDKTHHHRTRSSSSLKAIPKRSCLKQDKTSPHHHVLFKQPTRWDEASEEVLDHAAADFMPQLPHRQISNDYSSICSSSPDNEENNVDELIANLVSNIRMEQERTRKRNSLVSKAA